MKQTIDVHEFSLEELTFLSRLVSRMNPVVATGMERIVEEKRHERNGAGNGTEDEPAVSVPG